MSKGTYGSTSQRDPTRRQSHHSHSSHVSADSIPPPDFTAIEARRPLYHRLFHWTLPRRVQLPLTCLSICITAIQANGVYCWPTYGPVVARMLELDGAQAQTIVVGGILGVYLMAAPLGALTDRYGPRMGSLISAVLSAVGYLSFSLLLSNATPETPLIHVWLTVAFFCVGAATVGAYFACLTCASLSFPSHPTLSLSLPLSLVGLSSLFLSSFSTLRIFQSSGPTTDLDPIKFLTFLGTLCPLANLFGALFMRVIPPHLPEVKIRVHAHGPEETGESDDESDEELDADAERYMTMSQSLNLTERTPLLIGGIEAVLEEVEEMERGKDVSWSVGRMLRDWEGFWAFGIILALCIGPSETIIASIGSILTSLLPVPTSFAHTAKEPANALGLRNKHVMILSLSSTFSRLITGVLADYLCPPAVAVPSAEAGVTDPNAPTHVYIQKRPIRMYRSTSAALCSLILAGVYAWSAGWLQTEKGLWVLSGGVGLFYGALFTLTPAIVSAHFGPTNFGLAWGMVSYFAALGSVLFSYLYALISVAVAEESGVHPPTDLFTMFTTTTTTTDAPVICYGPRCFRPSLWVATACAVVAGAGFIFIARRWRV